MRSKTSSRTPIFLFVPPNRAYLICLPHTIRDFVDMTLGAYWTKTKTFQSIMFSTQYVRTLSSNDESDLAFAYHDRRKDFSGFMDRAIKLAKAFQLVDNGKNEIRKTYKWTGVETRVSAKR